MSSTPTPAPRRGASRIGLSALLAVLPIPGADLTSARQICEMPVNRARSYERLDLGDNLRGEGFLEAASCAPRFPVR